MALVYWLHSCVSTPARVHVESGEYMLSDWVGKFLLHSLIHLTHYVQFHLGPGNRTVNGTQSSGGGSNHHLITL